MSSHSISRLFYEVGATSTLNADLASSLSALDGLGLAASQSGKNIITSFNDAINPTQSLASQIQLLEAAGKSQADIWTVYGDRLKTASEATEKMGQTIDPSVQKMLDFGKATEASAFSFESLGKNITDLATHPMQTLQSGLGGILESLGPVAVGIAAIGTAAVAVGKGMFNLGVAGADEAQSLKNLSLQSGMTTQDLQALKEIQKEAGLEGSNLALTIGMLNKELGEGTPPKIFAEACKALGVSLKDSVTGQSKDALTVLNEIGVALNNVEDPAKRAQLANEALGGRLRELIPLIEGSTQSLKEQVEAMKASGPVWDDITQEKLLAFHDMLAKIGRSWDTFVVSIESGIGALGGAFANLGHESDDLVPKLNPKNPEAIIGFYSNLHQHILDLSSASATCATNMQAFGTNVLASHDHAALLDTDLQALISHMKDMDKPVQTSRANFDAQLEQIKSGHKDLAALYGELADDEAALKKADDEQNRAKAMEIAQQISDTHDYIKAVQAVAQMEQKRYDDGIKLGIAAAEANQKYADDALRTEEELEASLTKLMNKNFPENASAVDFNSKMATSTTDWLKSEMMSAPEIAALKKASELLGEQVVDKTDKTQAIIRQSVSQTFDRMESGIAQSIVQWKGFGDSVKSIFEDLATSAIKSIEKILFSGIEKRLTTWLSSLASGGSFGAAPLLGGGGGLLGMLGIGASALPGAGVGLGAGAASSSALAGAAAELTGGSAATGIAGMGMTIPIIGIAVAAGIAAYLGVQFATGPSSWQAADKEIARDLGLDGLGGAFASWCASKGITEEMAWPWRKELYTSPSFIAEIAVPYAQQKGSLGTLIGNLGNITTAWGTFSLQAEASIGVATGSWSAYNRAWNSSIGRGAAFGTLGTKLDEGGMQSVDIAVPTVAVPAVGGAGAGVNYSSSSFQNAVLSALRNSYNSGGLDFLT